MLIKFPEYFSKIFIQLKRRFAACKRSLNGVEVVISAKLPDNILSHSSHFRRWTLSHRGGRGGNWWGKAGTSKKRGKAMASYP